MKKLYCPIANDPDITREAILDAARSGDFQNLKQLLKHRTEDLKQLKASLNYDHIINSQDEDGRTALHYAVLNNHVDMVRYLLSQEAEIPLARGEGVRMDEIAPEDCTYPIFLDVTGIIRKFKIDVTIKDAYGDTPLDLAVLRDYREVAGYISMFMKKEAKKLFVTPEDSPDYEVNEDTYFSITFEYQTKVIQSFINNCREALHSPSDVIKRLLNTLISELEDMLKKLEEHAKDPRYASRMNKGVVPYDERIFIKGAIR